MGSANEFRSRSSKMRVVKVSKMDSWKRSGQEAYKRRVVKRIL